MKSRLSSRKVEELVKKYTQTYGLSVSVSDRRDFIKNHQSIFSTDPSEKYSLNRIYKWLRRSSYRAALHVPKTTSSVSQSKSVDDQIKDDFIKEMMKSAPNYVKLIPKLIEIDTEYMLKIGAISSEFVLDASPSHLMSEINRLETLLAEKYTNLNRVLNLRRKSIEVINDLQSKWMLERAVEVPIQRRLESDYYVESTVNFLTESA